MKIYVAGPYGDDIPKWQIALNVQFADEAGRALVKKGHTPFIPLKQTWHWEEDKEPTKDDFLRVDLEWLSLYEAVLLLAGWETSEGAKREKEEAETIGLTTYQPLNQIPGVARD